MLAVRLSIQARSAALVDGLGVRIRQRVAVEEPLTVVRDVHDLLDRELGVLARALDLVALETRKPVDGLLDRDLRGGIEGQVVLQVAGKPRLHGRGGVPGLDATKRRREIRRAGRGGRVRRRESSSFPFRFAVLIGRWAVPVCSRFRDCWTPGWPGLMRSDFSKSAMASSRRPRQVWKRAMALIVSGSLLVASKRSTARRAPAQSFASNRSRPSSRPIRSSAG